jgi:hypothetical protein
MNDATIYPKQILYDFKQIKNNKILKYDKKNNKFEWAHVDGKIVGTIDLGQRSAPTSDVEIYHIVNDVVVYAYTSHAYHTLECSIEWFDEETQQYFRIETTEYDPYDIIAKGIHVSDGSQCKSHLQYDSLEINDGWNVQHVHVVKKE